MHSMGFFIWQCMAFVFIVLGFVTIFSKREKPFGFWANAKAPKVKNVKAYNRALGKLWIAYGVLMGVDGIPLLGGQNAAGAVFSILGLVFVSIGTMVVYTVWIEPRYRALPPVSVI